MIMKTKLLAEIGKIPVKYNGETIGIAYIKDNEIVMAIDKYESIFKKALCQQGLTGFSFEIVGDK